MIRVNPENSLSSNRVVSILGVGGPLAFPPFRTSGVARGSAEEAARSMATSRLGSSDSFAVVSCTDALSELEARRGQAAEGERLLLVEEGGFAFAVEMGDSPEALAKWGGFSSDLEPKAEPGKPCLVISVEGGASQEAWIRSLSVSTSGEALAVAIASLAEKVLPNAADSSVGARPWFTPVGNPRAAFLQSPGGFGLLTEGSSEACGCFPLEPSCHGVFLSASSVQELAKRLQEARERDLDRVVLGDEGPERLVIVAPTVDKLQRRMQTAAEKLSDSTWSGSPRNGIFRGTARAEPPRLAWLFDGQGSQHFQMMADLMILFPRMRERLEEYEAVVEPGKRALSVLYPWEGETPSPEANAYLAAMEGGASVAFVLNLALAELLRECGVPCDVMAGHSNGENSALIAGGVLEMSDEDVLQCCRVLIAEAEYDHDTQGQALAVSLDDREEFESILEEAEGSVFLALDNCPHQVILFGGAADIAKVRERLEESGAVCSPLPFQRPFHTPWFESGARSLAPFYELGPIGKGNTPVYSCAHLKPFAETRAEVVAMALSQFHMPVRFRELIGGLAGQGIDLFLEVGPGVSLKAFVDDTLGAGRAVSLASPRKERSTESFVAALAALFVKGVNPDLSLFGFMKKEGPGIAGGFDRAVASGSSSPDQQSVATTGEAGDFLQQHFALMNEFLASQRRVFETCFGGGVSEEPAAAPASEMPSDGDLPWPMLGERVKIDGKRLEGFRTFTIQSDPFLLDHTLGRRASRRRAGLYGLPVLPFTFSMELIAEAARRLVGHGKVVTAIEEARGHRWLAVDRVELNLRIEAVAVSQEAGEDRVQVTIYEQLATGTEMKAFEGMVLLADRYPEAPKARFGPVEDLPPKRLNVPDFYRFGMFHGPRFQNIRRVKHLSATEVDADLQVFFLDDFFEAGEAPAFQISPNLLDCAGQLTAYSMLEHVGGYYGLFPFRVGALRLYGPPPASGVRVRARGALDFDGQNTTMDFDYLNSSGGVLFRLESKQQRCFEFPKRYHMATFWPEAGDGLGAPWLEDSGFLVERVDGISPDFLNQGWGIWKRALAHMILNEAERKAFYEIPAEGPRRNEWLLGRAAAKAAIRRWARREFDLEIDSADVEIRADNRGRPYAVCPEIEERAPMPSLSVSHTREVAVAAIDPEGNGVGIDLETPEQRKLGDWLLSAFSESELTLVPDAKPEDLLPLWCAKEAAAKACGSGFQGVPENWLVVSVDGPMVEVEHEGQRFFVKVFQEGGDLVAACQLESSQPIRS